MNRHSSVYIERLAAARVDSITALGSTGSYAYLSYEERTRIAQLAVEHAGDTPVFVGIGALRTSHMPANAGSAEQAGASELLLAPVSYQPLTDDVVFALFRAVISTSSLPVIVYDNPDATQAPDIPSSIERSPASLGRRKRSPAGIRR